MSWLNVFAYGSLVEEPSHPDAVREVHLARVPGLERRFCLRSRYRGCPDTEARYPDRVVPDFVDGGFRESLVLGTRPAPDTELVGAVVRWWDPDGRIVAAVDRREGVDPHAPEAGPYRRERIEVEVNGRTESVWTYPANPDHPRYVTLSVAEEAEVLLHATPRVADRDRGALYLVPLARWLRRNDVPDPYVEDLMAALEHRVGTLPEPVLQPGPYGTLYER